MSETLYRFAVIESGVVVNVTLADRDYGAAQPGWVESATAQMGDLWDGENFTRPPPPPEAPPPSTPLLDQLAAELQTTTEQLVMLLGGQQ